MALRIAEEFSLSDVGRQRHTNEDSFYEASPIFAVADGMGGARAGEVASRMAVEAFGEDRDANMSPEAQLAHIARSANKRIYQLAQEDSSRAGMGTTFTAVMVTDNELAIGHVGDSRAYRLRGGELERLTQDHSLVEELVRQGKLAPEEAEVHPQRSIITRALGPEPDVDVETLTYPARDGDIYLLCSDGLTGMVNETRVGEILRESDSLERAGTQLVAEANQNGGRDNITVVLFRVEDGGGEDDPDTLSGDETRVGVDAKTVAAAVREADEAEAAEAQTQTGAKPTDPAKTQPGTKPSGEDVRSPPRDDITTVRQRPDLPPEREPEPAAQPKRRRRWLIVAIVVLALAAIAALLYLGARQFYFIDTNDRGVVTLYRGLPYDLPFGLDLYDEEYVSSVPAASIQPERRRERVLDQQLRSHDDAVDLIEDVEAQSAQR